MFHQLDKFSLKKQSDLQYLIFNLHQCDVSPGWAAWSCWLPPGEAVRCCPPRLALSSLVTEASPSVVAGPEL